MRLRPWILLYRTRLLWCAAVSILAAFLYVLVTAGTMCDCQAPLGDAFVLSVPFTLSTIFLAGILGLGVMGTKPGTKGFVVFQFTRPAPREELLVLPLLIAILAVVVLPVLGWVLVLEGLRVFQPSWLPRLLRIVEMIPAASGLGPHPTLRELISSLHMVRRCMAATSVGLCAHAVATAQRWFLLSDNGRISLIGGLISLAPALFGVGTFVARHALSAALLFPSSARDLAYLPSNLGIGLHLAFAAILLAATWQVLRKLEV